MTTYKNLTGQTFGELTVIERADDHVCPSGQHIRMWKCVCSCGNITNVSSRNLQTGNTKSCGCKSTERKTKHGLWGSRIYKIWYGIRGRCYNAKSPNYSTYGGRGIIMCDEWKNDFMAFYKWSIEHGYDDNLSIDRIDVNGNYCSDNCRWVDRLTQENNKRNTNYVTYKGETKPLAVWCRELNLKHSLVSSRIQKGWNVATAFETPCSVIYRSEDLITYNDKTQTINEWCIERGLKLSTVFARLHKGLDIEQALSPVSEDHRRKSIILYNANGDEHYCSTITECAKFLNVAHSTIRYHIKRYGLPCSYKGWTIEEALVQ